MAGAFPSARVIPFTPFSSMTFARCATILSSGSAHDRPKESGSECWAVAVEDPASDTGTATRRRG